MVEVALAQSHMFRAYPALWERIVPHCRKKPYEKGTMVVHHGEEAGALWLVIGGWVKIFRQTPDGKEAILGLATDGDLFGEAAFFAHGSYPYHAEALTDAELIMIPAAVARDTIQGNSEFSRHVMSMLNERIAETQLKLDQMTTLSAVQRLGCFLLRLCRDDGAGRKTLRLPVEKHVLATYLGMKPETLSRSLQQLQQIQIEVKGQEMIIANVAALRDFVCNSCSESGMCQTEGEID